MPLRRCAVAPLSLKYKLMIDIDMNDYDYDLPADRIAQYPVKERDKAGATVMSASAVAVHAPFVEVT